MDEIKIDKDRITRINSIMEDYYERIKALKNYLVVLGRVKKDGSYKTDPKLTLEIIESEIINTDFLIRMLERIVKSDIGVMSMDEFFRTKLGVSQNRMYRLVSNGIQLRPEEKEKIILFINE
jgi:hypothetical protein